MDYQRKYFGTDGIRGCVGEQPITPDFMVKLGWSAGRILSASGNKCKVLIGKDTRISGYMLESALEAGLSAAGVDILLTGPMPTPAIAFLTRSLRAQAGIVISASHNPYYDNGIKFFCAQGNKFSESLEVAIEQQMQQPLVSMSANKLGKAARLDDAVGRYIEFCKRSIASNIEFSELRVVIDCANGATYHIAPKIFRELGAEVITIGGEPNGFNINAQCGSTNTQELSKLVVAERADLGIAFDGDGDRVIMVSHDGNIVDGDELLYILTKDRAANGRLHGGVVGTQMSNFGLESALKEQGIPFVRSAVGDRHVLAELKHRNWQLGGEPSGHIVCLDVTTTGDGIICALQVMSAMVRTQESLSQLAHGINKFPQSLINVPVDDNFDLRDHPQLRAAIRDAQATLAGQGRVLLRRSGTEPLLRVMVEGSDQKTVHRLATALAALVEDSVVA